MKQLIAYGKQVDVHGAKMGWGQKKRHRSAAFSMSKAVNSLDREAHHRALRSLGQFDEVHA